jgi:hypothetical protein
LKGRSPRAIIQLALRWKIVRWATSFAISGMNWIALAALPITPTRFPARSTSWFQRAEWKVGPRKVSRPAILGICGRDS